LDCVNRVNVSSESTSTVSGNVTVLNSLLFGAGSRMVVAGKVTLGAGARLDVLADGRLLCGTLILNLNRKRGVTPVQVRESVFELSFLTF
jgi:hypothetical protein